MTGPDAIRERLESLSPDKRVLLERLLVARATRTTVIPVRDRSVPAPLSPPQQRLWFMDQLAPGSPTYNAIVAIHTRGSLDTDVVREVMQRIIERHEVARTVIQDTDEPAQVVLDEWTFVMESVDVSSLALAERWPAAIDRVRAFARLPYDLSRDLPLRLIIVQLGADEHLLGFAEHHIAFDGWSDEVMFGELSEGYARLVAGREWDPEPLAVQYADVAAWWDSTPSAGSLEDYWRSTLEGAPPAVRLPVDRPHPDVQRFAGAHLPVRITGATDRLALLQTQESATSFMVLTAALAAMVYRWSGCSDLVFGTPFANRSRVEFEQLIGFFSNTVPLRFRVAGDASFRDLVKQSRTVCMGAFQHQELPFERIVELTRQERDPRRNPLFQVNVRVQQGGPPLPHFDGVEILPVEVDLGFSRFDIAFDLAVAGDGIAGYLEYNSDLFDEATITGLVDWTEELIANCLRRPDIAVQDLRFGPEAGSIRGRRRRSSDGTR